jgi:predicted Rossmann-fold nucleotide-binding protein
LALLNVLGFYDHLLTFLDHVVDEAFLKPVHRNMIVVADDPGAVLTALSTHRLPTETKWIGKNER